MYFKKHLGLPISHAPGNVGDIELYGIDSNKFWLVEVTLIRNKQQQQNNETTSLIRHLSRHEFPKKYMSLVAPVIHADTRSILDICIVREITQGVNIYIKPYTGDDFLKRLNNKDILGDMETYSNGVISNIRNKLN